MAATLILKKINNNFALALDDDGSEVVVYGSGVGFPKTPYVLEDESVIDRVYRSVDSDVLNAIGSLPAELLDMVAEMVAMAERELACELNANLTFTLADHIQFAIERACKGIEMANPFDVNVELAYPQETDLARQFLAMLRERQGIALPEVEVSLCALHLISAEGMGSKRAASIEEAKRVVRAIDYMDDIVCSRFGLRKEKTYVLMRFNMHLRYLIQRCTEQYRSAQLTEHAGLVSGDAVLEEHPNNLMLLAKIRDSLEREHACAVDICSYLEQEFSCRLGDEEVLYLMLYIARLAS